MANRRYLARHQRIDFAMTESKVSAEALGRAAGHSDGSYIRRMRRGKKEALKATEQTARAVSQMLGLPLDYLFVELDPRSRRVSGDSKSPVTASAT